MADSKLTALTATTTPFEDDVLYIVIDTGTTPIERKIKYSDLVEAKIVGTARQYTKGQGGTVTALSISTNETDIDFTDNNFFSLSLTDDTEIQLPTNDRPFSCAIFAAQDATGGRTLTFAAGYTVKGDTAPTAADDLFTIQITSNGAGRRIVTILDEQ